MRIGDIGGAVDCVVVVVQAEDGIRDLVRSRGLGDVYKRQGRQRRRRCRQGDPRPQGPQRRAREEVRRAADRQRLSLIHI